MVFWILFCVLHSLFAARWWKVKMSRLLGRSFRFYRFYYSVFATLSLLVLLVFQVMIKSPVLWRSSGIFRFVGLFSGSTGIIIMLACMKKYFSDVSGIRAFSGEKNTTALLLTEGLHNHTRHPLYFGTLLFIWSLFLLFPLLSNLISCCLISVYTVAGIHIEERKLVMEFGENYKDYARKVPMLIPRFFMRRTKIPDSVPEAV
jgi:protein-S-isoprenylcysteine O-methyltransferase Ste14